MTTSSFKLSAAHEWIAHDPFGKIYPGERFGIAGPIPSTRANPRLSTASPSRRTEGNIDWRANLR